MSRKLTGTTIVTNPATMTAEVLLGGSVLPSWAEGLVGDHLLTGQARPNVDTSGMDPKTVAEHVSAALDKASKADLKAYAEEHGIDLGSATRVADMRAVITAAEDAEKVAAEAAGGDAAPASDDDPAIGGDEDDEAADAADESTPEED